MADLRLTNLATGRIADTGGNEPKAFELGGQACSQAVTAGAVEQLEADLLRLRSGIDRRLLGCLPPERRKHRRGRGLIQPLHLRTGGQRVVGGGHHRGLKVVG